MCIVSSSLTREGPTPPRPFVLRPQQVMQQRQLPIGQPVQIYWCKVDRHDHSYWPPLPIERIDAAPGGGFAIENNDLVAFYNSGEKKMPRFSRAYLRVEDPRIPPTVHLYVQVAYRNEGAVTHLSDHALVYELVGEWLQGKAQPLPPPTTAPSLAQQINRTLHELPVVGTVVDTFDAGHQGVQQVIGHLSGTVDKVLDQTGETVVGAEKAVGSTLDLLPLMAVVAAGAGVTILLAGSRQ